jgi:hypothetical protein
LLFAETIALDLFEIATQRFNSGDRHAECESNPAVGCIQFPAPTGFKCMKNSNSKSDFFDSSLRVLAVDSSLSCSDLSSLLQFKWHLHRRFVTNLDFIRVRSAAKNTAVPAFPFTSNIAKTFSSKARPCCLHICVARCRSFSFRKKLTQSEIRLTVVLYSLLSRLK